MQLETKHFGKIDVDEKEIVDFPEGIPGFEGSKKFIVLSGDDPDSPFKWLQGVDAPQLAFAIVDPFFVKKDYDFNINEEIVRKLEIEKAEDVAVYAIVVVPEDISQMTMNLKAPVLVNARNHKGTQIVLDTDRYSMRHYILEELRKQEVAANACTDKEEGPDHHHK